MKFEYIVSESAIVPEGRLTRLKKSGFYELLENGSIERKMQRSVQTVVVLNEKEACIFFRKMAKQI
uniref:Transcriptional regulator protein-like protein n=1 Tax=uncultured marine thaumarchaeote AD1000_19_G10 TaxID=1455898 RepID=A0A075FLF4_9ARCH|nr:transcriptional regulator protein-like protein [uncultured marine thaumarchaeote AD1000_19_G10]